MKSPRFLFAPVSIFYIACFSFISSTYLNIATAASTASKQHNYLSPVGINTNEAMDVDSSVPFLDLFRMSLPFEEARPWLTKGKIEYDQDGWPRRLNGGKAGTRFISQFPVQSIPNGVYTVLYDGEGTITYGAGAKLIRHSQGKDLIRFVADRKRQINATLTITETNPDNHIRRIRILMPGGICKGNHFTRVRSANECARNAYLPFAEHYESIIFNPDYLTFMRDFRVIRFMNMAGITRNNLSKWEDRPKVTQATWGGKEGVRGVPLEIMIALANKMNADPWFNLPHRADDHFVEQYATYTEEHLKPGLKAYIEYTNEAWNGIFTQKHDIKARGKRLKLDVNDDIAGYKYYSRRSVEIFKIWESVFGNPNRLVRVMGGMATNVALTHMLLGYNDAYQHTDALAIAPYFHATQEEQKALTSVDAVFDLLKSPQNRYSIPNTLKVVRHQSTIAAQYGVHLIAYEGGQHLVAYRTHSVNTGSNPYLIQANKDKRMARLYYEFLKGWRQAGGKLFVAFSAPRSYNWIGSWGIKEFITQASDAAPKYQGLMYFKNSNKCWWYGCSMNSPIARMSKPRSNPGREVMLKRFNSVRKVSFQANTETINEE